MNTIFFIFGLLFGGTIYAFADHRPKVLFTEPPVQQFTNWSCYLRADTQELICAPMDKVLQKLADELDSYEVL